MNMPSDHNDLLDLGYVSCGPIRSKLLRELGLPVNADDYDTSYIPAWLHYLCTMHWIGSSRDQPSEEFVAVANRLKDDAEGQRALLIEGRMLGALQWLPQHLLEENQE